MQKRPLIKTRKYYTNLSQKLSTNVSFCSLNICYSSICSFDICFFVFFKQFYYDVDVFYTLPFVYISLQEEKRKKVLLLK